MTYELQWTPESTKPAGIRTAPYPKCSFLTIVPELKHQQTGHKIN
jgi:hypothetical protein